MIRKWVARVFVVASVLGVFAWILRDYGLYGLGLGKPTVVEVGSETSSVESEGTFETGVLAVRHYRLQLNDTSRFALVNITAHTSHGRANDEQYANQLRLYVDREPIGTRSMVMFGHLDLTLQKQASLGRTPLNYALKVERSAIPDAHKLTQAAVASVGVVRAAWHPVSTNSESPTWRLRLQGDPKERGFVTVHARRFTEVAGAPPTLHGMPAWISVGGSVESRVLVCLLNATSGRTFEMGSYQMEEDEWGNSSFLRWLTVVDLEDEGLDLELTLASPADVNFFSNDACDASRAWAGFQEEREARIARKESPSHWKPLESVLMTSFSGVDLKAKLISALNALEDTPEDLEKLNSVFLALNKPLPEVRSLEEFQRTLQQYIDRATPALIVELTRLFSAQSIRPPVEAVG